MYPQQASADRTDTFLKAAGVVLWLVTCAIVIISLGSWAARGFPPQPTSWAQGALGASAMAIVALVYGTVAAALILRAPRHPIGWVFVAIGLSMAVITEDYRRWRLFREECDFGMGYVNLPCIGAEVHLPFGGVKKSGNGQPSAAGLVDSVTHKISFTVNHDRKIVMAQGMSAKIEDT